MFPWAKIVIDGLPRMINCILHVPWCSVAWFSHTCTHAFAPALLNTCTCPLHLMVQLLLPSSSRLSFLPSPSPQHQAPTITRVMLLSSHVWHARTKRRRGSIHPPAKEWGTGSVSCTTTTLSDEQRMGNEWVSRLLSRIATDSHHHVGHPCQDRISFISYRNSPCGSGW